MVKGRGKRRTGRRGTDGEGGNPKSKLYCLRFCWRGYPKWIILAHSLFVVEESRNSSLVPPRGLAVPIEARSPLFLVQKSSFRSSVGMRPFLPSRLTYEDITKYRNDDLAATAAVSQVSEVWMQAGTKKLDMRLGRNKILKITPWHDI